MTNTAKGIKESAPVGRRGPALLDNLRPFQVFGTFYLPNLKPRARPWLFSDAPPRLEGGLGLIEEDRA